MVSCGTGLLLIGAGLVHVSAASDHQDIAILAVGFLISAYLQVALGALMIARRLGRLLLAGGVAMTVTCVGLWLLSRTVGLEFLGGEPKEPIGFKDACCVLFEVCALPGLLLLASRDLDGVVLPPALGRRSLNALGAGVLALLVPAVVFGGHHHAHQDGGLAAAHHGAGHARLAAAGAHATHATHPASHSPAVHAAAGHVHRANAGHTGHPPAAHAAHSHRLRAGGQPGQVHRHAGGGVSHPVGHSHPPDGPGRGHRHTGTGAPHQHTGAGGGQGHGGHPPAAPGGGEHHHPEPQPQDPVASLTRQVTDLLPPR